MAVDPAQTAPPAAVAKTSLNDFPETRFLHLLDRHARERGPKYLVLRRSIIEMVETGHLPEDAKLPPEQRLTQISGFSLGTVQKALNSLADDGYLLRRQGHGTFVTGADKRLRDPLHLRFVGDDGSTLLPVFAEVVSVDVNRDEGPWSVYFGPGTDSCVRITRLIDVNGEFQCFNNCYGSVEAFGPLLRHTRLDGLNLKKFIASQTGIETRKTTNLVRAGPLSTDAARMLGLTPGAIGLILESHGQTRRGTPIYYQITEIPANSRQLLAK